MGLNCTATCTENIENRFNNLKIWKKNWRGFFISQCADKTFVK